MTLVDQILLQNVHWEEVFTVPLYHRDMFHTLIDKIQYKFIITVLGPRRVGKTTVLRQLINYLVREKGVNPRKILYFSLDLYTESLLSIYNSYVSIQGLSTRGQYYLIFDEIQYLENWASHVKLLYDSLECKIIISGSSASELRRGRESLAGREIELMLDPLSFKEYLELKGIGRNIDLLLWREYLIYMDHQLPELVDQSFPQREYVTQLVDKVINYDFVRLHNIRDTTNIDTIFRIVCKYPGQVIIINDLSKEIGLDRRTVQQYLTFLEQSLLIRKLYNHSGNPRKSENRHKRYYPYYTTLHWYTQPYQLEFGKKAETEIAFQLSAEYFWRENGLEIDFIIGDELKVGVEAKMRNVISKKHIRALLSNKFITERFVIVKQNTNVLVNNEVLKIIPLHRISEIKNR